MDKNYIINKYFEWMTGIVCGKRFEGKVTYRKLLSYLHTIPFRCVMRSDENRVADGVDLRWRFAVDIEMEDRNVWIRDCLEGPCSVLEMMVALAIRTEETIMDNPALGDRTGQWFWGMIATLG